MTIGERIKAVRKFQGMTQKELGLALGYPESCAGTRVLQYEKGQRSPKKNMAIAIADILNCNYLHFYAGADVPEEVKTMIHFFWLEESLEHGIHVPSLRAALSASHISNYMQEWEQRFEALQRGEISRAEYFEWKLNWTYQPEKVQTEECKKEVGEHVL